MSDPRFWLATPADGPKCNDIDNRASGVMELPMTFMDMDLPREDGSDSTFTAMLHYVAGRAANMNKILNP